jgi:hypothetical protein
MWRRIKRALRPSVELRPVTVQYSHELIIFDVSQPATEVSLAQEAKIGEQLAQPSGLCLTESVPRVASSGPVFPGMP